VGSGGSHEAEYTLKAAVPAGTYKVICDAIIIRPVDVTFDLVWRQAGGDTTLATWMQHFEPLPGGVFDAQPYELDVPVSIGMDEKGSQFIFRYSGMNSTAMMAFIPNGDGDITGGRIPNITLPK
jgi:hypothetical protein